MSGIDAYGVVFERSDMAGSPTFTAIANVNNIGGPELERETHDVTAHDSPDGWRQFIGGLKDGGEVTLELHYDPSKHDVLVADFDDTAPRNYRLTWPQGIGDPWTFGALLTGFKPEAPIDDKLSCEVKFKVSGKPVIG